MQHDAATKGPLELTPSAQPLIGRAEDLDALRSRLAAAERGEGGVVLVGGEPGIGKSRLLREFSKLARDGGWLVLTGRAYDSEGLPPYLPFVEALRPHLAAMDDHVLGQRLAAEALGVALLVPELRARLPSTEEGSSLAPEAARYRLFEGVSEVLLRSSQAAECSGLLLVLDDLHWADRPTALLLLHFARKLPGKRVLMAGSYRTEEVDPSAPFFDVLAELARERLDTRLVLAPLSLEGTGRLAESLGLTLSDDALAQVYAETRGNPFYVEEVARQLKREGIAADGSLALPEGVRQVIGRRLAHLKAEAQRFLQAGAVLGDGFLYEIAARMTGDAEAAVMDALEEAIRAGFLRERGEVCHFSHPLIQRTVYDGLTAARRRALHLRAAETIERTYARHPEPHLSALAANYRLAGARADPDKTIDYLVRAGEAAERAFAYEQAASHWQAALDLMEQHAFGRVERAGLLVRLGELMQVIGMNRYGEGVSFFERALKLYDEAGATMEKATVHARVGLLLAAGGPANDNDAAMRHFRAAEPILADAPPLEAQLWLYSGLGLACVWQFRPDEGLAASRKAVELATVLGRHDRWVTNTVMCAYHLHHLGRLAQGFELLQRAWERAREFDQTYPGFVAASWLGMRLVDLLDPREALAPHSMEAEERRQVEAPQRRGLLMIGAAYALLLLGETSKGRALLAEHKLQGNQNIAVIEGRWDSIEPALARARENAAARAHPADRATAGLLLARLLAARGDPSAIEVLQDTFSAAVAGPAAVVQMCSGPELAIQLALHGRRDEAEVVVQRCRELLAYGEDWRGRAGRVALAEAAIAYACGRLEEADERFEAALDVFQRYSLPWDEAEAHHLRGRLLARLGKQQRPQAAGSFDAAAEIYRRIDAARPWLDALAASRSVSFGRATQAREGYPGGLSEREAEVPRLIAAGKSNREISDDLVLSVRTVERHITNIYAKISARSKADATAYALRHGLS